MGRSLTQLKGNPWLGLGSGANGVKSQGHRQHEGLAVDSGGGSWCVGAGAVAFSCGPGGFTSPVPACFVNVVL